MKRDILIELRGDKTQSEMAKLLGITQQALSYIENGMRKPKPEHMAKFEKIYKKPVQKLFPDIFFASCYNDRL